MPDDAASEFAFVARSGRYEIPIDPATGERRELGKGGMGVTYKARDAMLGRMVVLKVISRALQGNSIARKRFLREAKALAVLKHPGVPVIYEYGEESGDAFYAMEFIEGEDLRARVKRSGELSLAEALNLAEQAARALGAAHRAGIIHRDIKPANLMLTRSEHGAGPILKLIDFGLAKGVAGTVDLGMSTTGDAAWHTPLYASPEQCRKEPATQKSDLYSLGATLWCLLTGKGPFGGTSVWEVENKHISAPVPLEKLPAGLPLPVIKLLERLLAKKPEDRPETADEVAEELSLLRKMVEVPAPAPAPPNPPLVLPPPPKPAPARAPSADPRDATGRGGGTPDSGVWLKRLGLPGVVVAVLIGLVVANAGWFKSGALPEKTLAPKVLPTERPTPVPQPTATPHPAPTATPALKPTALPESIGSITKERPYVNDLGMKFVPVAGAEVLFSVWDTRVRDYKEFADETIREWLKPDFTQTGDHPAVNVSWQDAQAFCEWLTTRERAAGRIGANQRYRLPTDSEWSTAVGLPKETGATPKDRDGKIEDVYPWNNGKGTWPPPNGAGNYASTLKVDDFATTSPVGSFAANEFGLFDMGGNVWQWCEDWYGDDEDTRVLRGGSWVNGVRGGLLSSCRGVSGPTDRYDFSGFRVVLAGDRARAGPSFAHLAFYSPCVSKARSAEHETERAYEILRPTTSGSRVYAPLARFPAGAGRSTSDRVGFVAARFDARTGLADRAVILRSFGLRELDGRVLIWPIYYWKLERLSGRAETMVSKFAAKSFKV